MNFDLIKWMMNPFILMFVTVFLGMLVGKILKIGTSGTLFTGLGIGWLVMKKANNIIAANKGHLNGAKDLLNVNVIDKNFFILFLILFVASVGLLAADKIGIVIKKYGVKFIILGFFITFIGAGTSYLVSTICKLNTYKTSGVYTGALTSSPGLATALETARDHVIYLTENYKGLNLNKKINLLETLDSNAEASEKNFNSLTSKQVETLLMKAETGVGIGYAVGYPFGVIIVILAMKLLPKLFRINLDKEYEIFRSEMQETETSKEIKKIKPCTFDLVAFVITCISGYTFGMIKIYLGPLGYFSLGSTGSVLIISLILGSIGQIGGLNFRMDKTILRAIKEIGLAFFLSIVGLRYGFEVIESISGSGLYIAIVAVAVGILSMLIGFIFGRYVLKINWIMLSGAICGGMTSTPGLGAATDAIGSDDPAAGYGATYPFALFGMILYTIILYKL